MHEEVRPDLVAEPFVAWFAGSSPAPAATTSSRPRRRSQLARKSASSSCPLRSLCWIGLKLGFGAGNKSEEAGLARLRKIFARRHGGFARNGGGFPRAAMEDSRAQRI
jgi:hypothetical protein